LAEADGARNELITPSTDNEAATAARDAETAAAAADALLTVGVVDGAAVFEGGVLAGELVDPPPQAESSAAVAAAASRGRYLSFMVCALPLRALHPTSALPTLPSAGRRRLPA
jgi:hypothetical protein